VAHGDGGKVHELAINLKTVKAFGIDVRATLPTRGDRVACG